MNIATKLIFSAGVVSIFLLTICAAIFIDSTGVKATNTSFILVASACILLCFAELAILAIITFVNEFEVCDQPPGTDAAVETGSGAINQNPSPISKSLDISEGQSGIPTTVEFRAVSEETTSKRGLEGDKKDLSRPFVLQIDDNLHLWDGNSATSLLEILTIGNLGHYKN